MASINVKFVQSFSFQLEGSYAVLGVTRESSSDFTGAFSVDYSCIAITATAGVDFDSVSGTLNFASNENLKYIEIPIYNDSSTDPMESFIVSISNLQASGATSKSITTSAHAVYIVDSAPQPQVTPTETATQSDTETETPPTQTTTQSDTETQTSTDTETQTLIYVTPTDTETPTHTVTESRTPTLIPIIFPTITPRPINPYPTCWCTPSGTICPPRPRPSPIVATTTTTPTYLILPPNAPNYVIVNGRCYKKTSQTINTTELNYNYGGNFENCENCNETLFQSSDSIEHQDNPPLGKDSIYQKYVLGSVFDDRYWQSEDQNLNSIYGNLLYNTEPAYGASILIYNKDGTLINQAFSSSGFFNININHNPDESYSMEILYNKTSKQLNKDITFYLPGQKFSIEGLDIKDV